MKTVLYALAGLAVLLALLSDAALGQGLVNFDNRLSGVVVAPVYGQEPLDPLLAKTGNTSSGTPAGIQTYGGALLAGATYTAELWGGAVGTREENLSPLASTTFRSAGFAGFVAPPVSPVTVPGVPAGSLATLQLRVWDNQSGNILSWEAAQARATNVLSGASRSFTSAVLGDGVLIPVPSLVGLVSFNIHLGTVPELRLDWATIDGGGGTSTNGQFSLSGTVGQSDAGGPMTGVGFSLAGGFWALYAIPSPGAPWLKIARTATNTVMVYWPSPSTGFNPELCTNLASPFWRAPAEAVQDDGTNKYLIVNPPVGRSFYRLKNL